MSTLRRKSGAIDRIPSVRVLTILCHPDPSRVGERARLEQLASGLPTRLSRLEPDFAQPDGGAPRPLADPYLSRQPLEIAIASAGHLRLSPPQGMAGEIAIDGLPMSVPTTVVDDPGVVLLLSQRVVLLLHQEPLLWRPVGGLGLVGESGRLDLVRRRILDVAPTSVSVLIRGESGTGKELVAQAIHGASPRATGPFVAANMSTLTPSLAASELFGHVRGAFTDAREAKLGLFAKADGGTLFLDEVGQTSGEVQAGLLRALETGEVQPVGSDRPRRVDVRILAATDTNLEQAIAEGRFMEALFHRLGAYEIRLPPLRERVDDIGRLLVHFLRRSLKELGSSHRLEPSGPASDPWLSAPLVDRLTRHSWPGNVRELRNAATQIAISSHREPRSSAGEDLERRIAADGRVRDTRAQIPAVKPVRSGSLRPSDITLERLVVVLQDNDWNLVRTATELSISRTSLYLLIDKHRLSKAIDLPSEVILRCRAECGEDLDAMARRLRVSKRALTLRLAKLG